MNINEKQAAIMAAVDRGARSFRDVASAVGLSPSITYKWCRRLQSLGWLDWEVGKDATLHLGPDVVIIMGHPHLAVNL